MATCRPAVKLTHCRATSCSRLVVPSAHGLGQRHSRLVARAIQPPETPSQESASPATPAAQPVAPENPAQATVPAAAPGQESLQAKAAAFLQALSKHRRVITFAVAVADVAFIWVCVKLGVNFFHHD